MNINKKGYFNLNRTFKYLWYIPNHNFSCRIQCPEGSALVSLGLTNDFIAIKPLILYFWWLDWYFTLNNYIELRVKNIAVSFQLLCFYILNDFQTIR